MTDKVQRSDNWLWDSIETAALSCVINDNIFNSYSPVKRAEQIIEARDICKKNEKARNYLKTQIIHLKEKLRLLEELLPKEPIE